MTVPLDQVVDALLDELAERVAERAAGIVLERLRPLLARPQAADSQLLDVKSVAAKLSVPASAIYKMTSTGRLAAVKVGGRLRFRTSDIEAFIARGTRSAERVRALAADARRPRDDVDRRQAASRSSDRARGRRGSGDTVAPADARLKVIGNDNPDAARVRSSG